MGEQERREKAFGTLLAVAIVKGIEATMNGLTAQDTCVDCREGNAELVVYLNNGKILKVQQN